MVCKRHHCSNCLPKEPNKPSSHRSCTKCKQLSAGNLSQTELMKFKYVVVVSSYFILDTCLFIFEHTFGFAWRTHEIWPKTFRNPSGTVWKSRGALITMYRFRGYCVLPLKWHFVFSIMTIFHGINLKLPCCIICFCLKCWIRTRKIPF